MSFAFNFVRNLVSEDKRRYKKHGFDLDLTYITDRIIAMCFPSVGFEGAYRNHLNDVAAMLIQVHGADHFRIYNLSERKYDYSKVNNAVVEYGFPDHHNPPVRVTKKTKKTILIITILILIFNYRLVYYLFIASFFLLKRLTIYARFVKTWTSG